MPGGTFSDPSNLNSPSAGPYSVDPGLGLLSGVINYPDRPMRNRYLDLMSGLEAYHSLVHGIGPISLDTFAAKRKAVLDSLTAAGVDPVERKFIKRWLPTRPTHSLEHRIRQLASGVGVLESWGVDPQRMAALRNDVAHGNAGVNIQDLRQAFDQAFDLGRRLVLNELGIVNSPAP